MSEQDTKIALFQLMGQAQKLQQNAEKQCKDVEAAAKALQNNAQTYKRDAVKALSEAASEAMAAALKEPLRQLQAVTDTAQEGAALFRKKAKEITTTMISCGVVIVVCCSVAMGLFTGYYLDEKWKELAAVKAELQARNTELSRLPQVYDNIENNPGFWVVIDNSQKTLKLQGGKTVALLPRK